KAAYDIAKANYDTKVAEKAAADKANAEAEAKYQEELAAYNTAKAQYDQDKAAYDIAKANYDTKVAEKAAADKANAEAEAKYQEELAKYNADKTQYDKDIVEYATKKAEYETSLKQYKNAKEAYDKFLADQGLTAVQAAQELTFLHEPNATHTIDGINTYLTKEAQQRLNTNGVEQYTSDNIQASDIVTTSPWGNNKDEWIQIKEGDKFSITYDGLTQSKMVVDGVPQDIKKVIYRYKIISLPSIDGKGIANVNSDPTITLTVGSSTDKNKNQPIKVAVDIEFYDKDGNMFDLSKRNAIVALNSLNHWTGASYVDSGDKPRALTVEAKDVNGNTVRGTWDPYADGSMPAIQNNGVVVKTGEADFGDKKVKISASNPLKIVSQKAGWDNGWVIQSETVTGDTTVNASGGGNGHSIGSEEYTYNGNDDVLGTYKVEPETGLLTFTPKKKFQSTEHQESVNIGDKEFIAIPNSSVTFDSTTREATSVNDNQYIEHGAVFNGETSSTLRGWDDPYSPYLYYGGAGVKMTDGHLVFTAAGANADGMPSVYWFAINSNVGFPKDPGVEPKLPEEPTAPTPPVAPTKVVVEVPSEPTAPTAPTPPVAPTKVIVEVPSEPTAPTAPTPPVAPTKVIVEVPSEPTAPTAPTSPVAPTKVIVEVPSEPTAPTAPTPPVAPTKVIVEVPSEPTAPTAPTPPVAPTKVVVEVPSEPTAPTAPTPPVAPTKVIVEVPSEPTAPTAPTPPVAPTKVIVEVPSEPAEPTAPTPPVAPTKVEVEVPSEPTAPTAPTEPTAPTPPIVITVEVPAEPVAPTEPAVPKVQWHRNYIVETVKHVIPPTTPSTPISSTSENPKATPPTATVEILPETGESSDKDIVLTGAGVLALALAGLFGACKRKED
ncbi:GbpC/Spa domain-containing protein, partial [Streptococcus dentiloxodontae]